MKSFKAIRREKIRSRKFGAFSCAPCCHANSGCSEHGSILINDQIVLLTSKVLRTGFRSGSRGCTAHNYARTLSRTASEHTKGRFNPFVAAGLYGNFMEWFITQRVTFQSQCPSASSKAGFSGLVATASKALPFRAPMGCFSVVSTQLVVPCRSIRSRITLGHSVSCI